MSALLLGAFRDWRQSESLLPLCCRLPPRWAQGNVLHHAGLGAPVRAAAVRQGLMPEHQVTGLAGNRNQPWMPQNGLPRILRRRQTVQPLLQGAMKSRNTTEGSLIGRRIGEVENALNPEAMWGCKRRVPMHMGPGEFPATILRRIEAALIHSCPQVLSAPQLGKGLYQARCLAIG